MKSAKGNITKKETGISQIWFHLIALCTVFGLTLPVLIQDGMFQDGVLYSSVAHNLSMGYGTFWFPQYSALNLEGIPSFHEHPPLVFGIQAIFFKIFGDSLYVERFYSALMLLLHIILINWLWKTLFHKYPKYKAYSWITVMYFILIPVSFWSFRNNVLENTMGLFTLLAVIFGYKALEFKRHTYSLLILSGFFVFLAMFSKGVPGLFPLVLPAVYWLTRKKITLRQAVGYSLLMTSVPLLITGIMLIFPDSRENIIIYVYDRLLMRIEEMPTTHYRFKIVWRLFTESLPPILFTGVLLFSSRSKKLRIPQDIKSHIWFLFGLGLSASLPLSLTLIQKGWYLLPALPLISMAFASISVLIIQPFMKNLTADSKLYKFIKIFSVVLAIGVVVLTISQAGKASRHPDLLRDVYKIGEEVENFSSLSVPEEMYDQYDFTLQGYLVRYFNISLNPYESNPYFLTYKDSSQLVPKGYVKVNRELELYDLYKKE